MFTVPVGDPLVKHVFFYQFVEIDNARESMDPDNTRDSGSVIEEERCSGDVTTMDIAEKPYQPDPELIEIPKISNRILYFNNSW